MISNTLKFNKKGLATPFMLSILGEGSTPNIYLYSNSFRELLIVARSHGLAAWRISRYGKSAQAITIACSTRYAKIEGSL